MYDDDIGVIIVKALPFVLSFGLFIGGALSVKEPVTCDACNTYHVHLYKNSVFERWENNEKESNWSGYNKTNIVMPATKADLNIFNLLSGLHDGRQNLQVLDNYIRRNRDYLKYYYYYETDETREVEYTDSDGEKYTETEHYTEVHEGWSTDKYHEGNTGEIRIYHTRYYGYKLVCENNKYKLERSPYVDDIRSIIHEYPFVSENPTTEVYTDKTFRERDLKWITANDVTPYFQPDVSINPCNFEAIKDYKFPFNEYLTVYTGEDNDVIEIPQDQDSKIDSPEIILGPIEEIKPSEVYIEPIDDSIVPKQYIKQQ